MEFPKVMRDISGGAATSLMRLFFVLPEEALRNHLHKWHSTLVSILAESHDH